jgi:CRISPR-associated protein Cas5d
MKVERVSYDVITPSAARAIFEAIFWKPAIKWEITRIEVLNPIVWSSIRRNEIGALANTQKKEIFIERERQQKATLFLKDIRYRLYAKLAFIPKSKRVSDNPHEDCNDENPGKYNAIFTRRASIGQCFNQPYLGTREFSASFKLITNPDDPNLDKPIKSDQDFGFMLYDMDFSKIKNPKALFFRCKMNQGVIVVPSKDSEEVLK